jgi:hypothetical protein
MDSDLDMGTGRLANVKTLAGPIPLFAGAITPEWAKMLAGQPGAPLYLGSSLF